MFQSSCNLSFFHPESNFCAKIKTFFRIFFWKKIPKIGVLSPVKRGFWAQTYVMKSLISRLLFRKLGFSRKSRSRKSGFDCTIVTVKLLLISLSIYISITIFTKIIKPRPFCRIMSDGCNVIKNLRFIFLLYFSIFMKLL